MNDPVQFRFALGQRVLVPTDNSGTVIARTENKFGTSYHVVWWCESKRNDEWLFDFELRAAP